MMMARPALLQLGLLVSLTLGGFLLSVEGEDEMESNHLKFTSRYLMEADEKVLEDALPIPKLDFWISGETYPNKIDGGSVLVYNWLLTHKVEPEHTAMNVTFEVGFPSLAFHQESVNVTLSSHSFEMNATEIRPIDVTWLQDESKVQLTVDISEPLWINLTKPWRLPDCWWTPGQQCYKTTYEDCIFYDTSEEQNWDPASCHHFNVSQCLPHNTTSECFYVHPYECLSRLLAASAEDPGDLLCPMQPNTSCIQVNDRGLFFTQYDWTVPTKAPILKSFNKELCGMSTEEIFTYEEDHNGTVYTVDSFISEDPERDCRTVLMKLKPMPTTPAPTYNPYKDLPTTTDYLDAKECINVNTTGFYYPPPDPIHWQDFNLTVVLTGELSNFVEVNQNFEPVLTANITQSTRVPDEQLTSVSVSTEYKVKKPALTLKPIPSFSEKEFALKREQIFYELVLNHPEVLNHGVEVTISFPPVGGEVRMTFINETPWWEIGANLVATTRGAMFNETSDEAGHLVTMETIQTAIAEAVSPGVFAAFSSTDGQRLSVIDQLAIHIDPFINIQDQKSNAKDKITMWFYSRVLTNVQPDQELSIAAKAKYKYSRDDFTSSHTPKLTVTDQPFIPLIPASDPTQSPDTADLVRYTFDLSHTLDFYVNDIWMNISCPDLQIVPNTLEMEFLEPDMNTTTNSSTDVSFTTETTYHIHLPVLAPGVNLLGNQTFLMWNNSMLTRQEIVCSVMLSYRKGAEALILPYVAGYSPALRLPGIKYELYPRDLVGQNDTMYYMPVGSNATYILNVTFPETSTKLDITLTMPSGVLAVYYAHVIHQGSRLTLEGHGTIAVETTNKYIDDWDIPARTVINLDFGVVKNLADNKQNSTGDNLILEFNVVLENTTELVTRDKEHTLKTTVSYSNGDDLVQEQTIHVWEPEVILRLNMSNETNAGDPGDVFQYYIHLSHTELSQSPAHHVVIELHLPYMAVYQDFIPSNRSHVPTTRIFDKLGQYEADGKLWLYLYKMSQGEVIEGTFLIQISTKLTEGIALLATSRYHIYSFYQWGRVYHYSTVSENVINIRNATLIFDGTSMPQTPDNLVAIHEQVMYTMRVPVPPIPSNLSVALDLPRFLVSLKTWEVLKLKEEIPRPIPIEGTFLRQGCFPNETLVTDACFCTNSLPHNGTFYRVYPDWLVDCMEIPKENCTGVDDGAVTGGDTRNLSTAHDTACNATDVNCTNCGTNTTANCSTSTDTITQDFVGTPEVCIYDLSLYDTCVKSVLKMCQINSSIPHSWHHIFGRTFHDQGSRDNESLSNLTQAGNQNQSQATPTEQPHTTPAHYTTAPQSTPSSAHHSQPSNQTSGIAGGVLSCAELARAFCEVATLHECILPEAVYNETGRKSWNATCACSYYEPPPPEPELTTTPAGPTDGGNITSFDSTNTTSADSTNATSPRNTSTTIRTNITTTDDSSIITITGDLYLNCRDLSISVQVTTPSPTDLNGTTSGPSLPGVCEEEEEVYFGMASVIHTDILSSREGVVCTFVGGNRHDPFHPGVFYISEHLPANLSEGGSTILVTVNMLILDLPELTRGDVLQLNATSIFSYVSYPVPPSSIYRENCTCQKPLEEHFDTAADKECFCETWHLYNMTDDQCNCTSYYVDGDDGFDDAFSCNCVNFCWDVRRYFLNPPHVAALQHFEADSCDCASLNITLLVRGPMSSLQQHVDNCLELYKRNYTCHNLSYTITHHEVPLVVNCMCLNATVDGVDEIPCSCDTDEILAKAQQPFLNNVTVMQCMNTTAAFDGEPFLHTFNRSDCSCPTEPEHSVPSHNQTANHTVNVTGTIAPYTTLESWSNRTNSSLALNMTMQSAPAGLVQSKCTCTLTCSVHVEQDCVGTNDGRCANITHTHSLPLGNSICQCHKIYKYPFNISDVMGWYQPTNETTFAQTAFSLKNTSSSCRINTSNPSANTTGLNNTYSNATCDTALNFTDISSSSISTYELECDCTDVNKVVYHVDPANCIEMPAFEVYDCDCFVPPDNETQFILDNWDYNATIIDQMITRKSHEVIIVEPELQITFTRRPEPSIVDSIDPVMFDFEITHTADSNAPAFNVTLQLDAVNFTRSSGFAELELSAEEPSCGGSSLLCDIRYDNAIGRFHLPLLPVDPAGATFKGTFNLSVGNHIDFVANSLITATGIAWYDSSITHFPGRLYPSIIAADTVQIDAPTIAAHLDFTTANSHMFLTSKFGEPPKTFSIGDYVRMEAKLWIPEITLQLLNFSMQAVMQNFTASSCRVVLSERIYHRNDTPSIYLEMENDPEDSEGYLYPGKQYNTAKFLENGVMVIPGVIVNEADNTADDKDYILLYFTFRVQDEPYWVQGVEIPFMISAGYVSDYVRSPTLLVDDSIVLTVIEPQLSLRAELLDHPWQVEQVRNQAGYTCTENTCCSSEEECGAGSICLTATDNMQDCATSECRCYSGFTSNEEGGCTAVGRTAGDVINYGLTATHHVDYTGNAFDVFILVHSELPADLIPDARFISHPPATNPLEADSEPALRQLSDRQFELYIKRFNHSQMCERFVVPHRIRPEVEVFAGKSWQTEVSMWYYSAKPYGTPVEYNTESRLYHLPQNITFNLTAPVPSARFCMLPPTDGGSSAIDFRVYSSSEPTHQLTVNLREEARVQFMLEAVVPKIRCNMTVLLALPEGDGFKFESVRIAKMGSQILFPAEQLSNESLTADLKGNKFFYAELPNIYSQPYTIDKQREFNSTIQRRFKTMKGEQRPYPTVPSCTLVNSTLFEKSMLLGCFHDLEHFFDVAIVTRDHPTNLNFTEAMTRQLCHKLCRDGNLYISATKKGSDCHCGNHTAYRRYADIAHSLYTTLNRTFLESYTETVYFDCNKTRKEWNYYTVVDACMHQEVYETCRQEMRPSCENGTATECSESFVVDCQEEAELACGGVADTDCIAAQRENCTGMQMMLCTKLAEKYCEGKVTNTCMEKAKESFHQSQDFRLSDDAQACCLDAYVHNCTAPYNSSCREYVQQKCISYGYLFINYNLSYNACVAAEFEQCFNEAKEACTTEGEEECLNTAGPVWNETAAVCDRRTTTLYNTTTANCTSEQLPDCTSCLYDSLKRCEADTIEGATGGCIEASVDDCTPWCMYERCYYEFHEVLVTYRTSNCSRPEAESFDVVYPATCSQDIVKWHNVTREVVDLEPVTLDFCNTTCTGDSNLTCGGEDFVLIYGPLEGSLAQQQCEWYAGLYSEEEDVFSLEFELSITPLLTKGITEILQPFVTYDHGEERKPTILPLAPYRLEAGIIQLDMNVWIAPDTKGFVPGDLIEFYTEVFHNPLSTLTGRDISVVWMFPTYVEYVNLTNHKKSLHEYNELQSAEALRTDPTKGFQFYVLTLRNTDMISFHFLVKLDPLKTLPQGEYHMVGLAEAYYYSWDLYNPHEDEFKHNVITHFHDVIPTKISFEVPTTYMGRPELEELKLSTYNALYDEVHNIMYACFYNNTKHVYEGGCFMTGNLPAYKVEVPPTCDDYCNCTYVWDLPPGANCSEFEPKPENCSCGCVPDCFEEKSSCEESCNNCTWCSYKELQTCLMACSSDHTNCTQDCCLDSCGSELDSCLLECSNCTSDRGISYENCSLDFNCTLGCSLMHGSCAFECVKPPLTCSDNCTVERSECLGVCKGVCEGHPEVHYPGVELNCTQLCDWDCVRGENLCMKGCCLDDCGYNHTICGENCLYTCRDNTTCASECLDICSSMLVLCNTTCDPPAVPCSQVCVSDLSRCVEGCNQTCAIEVCEMFSEKGNCSRSASSNMTVWQNGTLDRIDTSVNCTGGNCSSHNGTASGLATDCSTEVAEHCYTSADPNCYSPCSALCQSTSDDCDKGCCLLDCPIQRSLCIENCSDVCGMDVDCLQACSFSCADLYDRCHLDCIMPVIDCQPSCKAQYHVCEKECQPCGGYNPDDLNPSPPSSDYMGNEGHANFNRTHSENQTLDVHNGTSFLNESGMCSETLNTSACMNGSVNSMNITSTAVPTPTTTATPVNCSVEIADCHVDCNISLEDCVDQCPCEESCFRRYSTCWSSCYGCEPPCLETCESNCTAESDRCITGCVEPRFDPVVTCTKDCNREFNACLPGCLYNVTVNITRFHNVSMSGGQANVSEYNTVTFLNNTCLNRCVAANKDCLDPCLNSIAGENCTDQCFPGGVSSDFCSVQCNTYAYIYSNATLNKTFDSCYLECLSGCSNRTQGQNTSEANSTSSAPTEGSSTDSTSNTSSPSMVTSGPSYTTPVESGNVTVTSGTSTTTFSPTGSECVLNCRPAFPESFSSCTLNCRTEFSNCTRSCTAQNSSESLNQSVSCAEDCGRHFQECSVDCAHQLVFENCSLPCKEASDSCLEGCDHCLECRDNCHLGCISEKSTCLGICFPPTCEDLRSTCLHNCSVCDCTDACRTNCTSDAQDCSGLCLSDGTKSCRLGFMDCLERCSPEAHLSGKFSDRCVRNCSQDYALCTQVNLLNDTKSQNCSGPADSSGFTSETSFCNTTTGMNQTAVSCSNSTDPASIGYGLCMVYQVFNACVTSCDALQHSCLDDCEACLNDTLCFATCATNCMTDHYTCLANCYAESFQNNCIRNCSIVKTRCDYACTNCTLCPGCMPACEASYVNCTAVSNMETLKKWENITSGNDTAAVLIHPNCTAYRDCLNLCLNGTANENCSESGNCSESNCTQSCLQEFISPNCTSQDNCAEYGSICESHQRKKRGIPELNPTDAAFLKGHLNRSDHSNLITDEEMKPRYFKYSYDPRKTVMKLKGTKIGYGARIFKQPQGYAEFLISASKEDESRIFPQLKFPSHPRRRATHPLFGQNVESWLYRMADNKNSLWPYSGLRSGVTLGSEHGTEMEHSGEGMYHQALYSIRQKRAAEPENQNLPWSSVHHHVQRRSLDDNGGAQNGTSADANGTSSHFSNATSNGTDNWLSPTSRTPELGFQTYSYPVCSSNVRYLHYLNCSRNCSLLTDICQVLCSNFSLFCDHSGAALSNCSSSDPDSRENCSLGNACASLTMESCVVSCSGSCQNVCEELRPLVHRECYTDCNKTVSYCREGNGTSELDSWGSGHGEDNATNASMPNSTCPTAMNYSDGALPQYCSNPCRLPQHANVTACQQHCDQSASSTDCLQDCGNTTCSENTTCNCTCDCSALPEPLANQNCSYSEWSNGIGPCVVMRDVEMCSCACGCVEDPRSYVTTKWRALHSNIGNLLGMDPSTNTLYALSHHGLAVMRSRDFGESWVAVTMDVWHAARGGDTFIASTNLGQDVLLEIEPKQMMFTSSYWNDTWGVSGVGIHRLTNGTADWEVAGTWQCCKERLPNW